MNMTAQDMVNYVAASTQLINDCQTLLKKQASEIDTLKKSASANKPAEAAVESKHIELDGNMLMKTASVVHSIYGNPSTVTPEQIASYWRENPNTLLDTLHKFAAAQVERVANGEHIGSTRQEPVRKKATAEPVLNADLAFWKKYE